MFQNVVDREWKFPPKIVTDRATIDLAFEVIREKIFRHLNKEVPYSITQENVGWTEDKIQNILRIDQKLFVKKESQKVSFFIFILLTI